MLENNGVLIQPDVPSRGGEFINTYRRMLAAP